MISGEFIEIIVGQYSSYTIDNFPMEIYQMFGQKDSILVVAEK